jgi:hypothetical protein
MLLSLSQSKYHPFATTIADTKQIVIQVDNSFGTPFFPLALYYTDMESVVGHLQVF